jgi:glycosyltransferase involved in cell wall biosynthesis
LHVTLVVADGEGDELNDGVQIRDVGCEQGRLRRMTRAPRRMLDICLQNNIDICHLHDPELLAIGNKLRRAGKIVIFDAHEDGPAQILGKPYLRPIFRMLIAKSYGLYEASVCRGLDAVVAATPSIANKFSEINSRTVNINNYPIQSELHSIEQGAQPNKNHLCYLGGVSEIRGIREVVKAMALTQSDARLAICGKFSDEKIEAQAKSYAGWEKVDNLGWQDRPAVRDILRDSIAGLVTFHPLPNHVDAQPNKMFEYMSAGVPVIASDFPLWRDIIEGNNCGLCVDPLRPQEIAEAIDFLVANPNRADEMGSNGLSAVRDRFNWSVEKDKLVALYEELIEKVEF